MVRLRAQLRLTSSDSKLGGASAGTCASSAARPGHSRIPCSGSRSHYTMMIASGDIGTTFRELGWKYPILCGRAVPKTPNAT
jgi:hypothetical protein